MQKTKSVSSYLSHKSWTTTTESCQTYHSALQAYVSTTQSQKHGHFEHKVLYTPNQHQMYQLRQRPTAVSPHLKGKLQHFGLRIYKLIVMIKQHLSTISHYFQSDKKLDILNELAFLLRFSSQLATQNALQHLPHWLFTYRQRRPCKVRPAHHEQFNMLRHAVRESNQRPSDFWNINSASWAAVATNYTAGSQRKKRRDRTKMGEIIDIPATSSRSFPFPFIFLFLFLCTD